MKCRIDWCGKQLPEKQYPFQLWHCIDCKIIYFMRDGILESVHIHDLEEE